MIWAIVLLVLGLLLIVLPILIRKKLSRSWMISMLVTGLLLTVFGGTLGYDWWAQNDQQKKDTYIGLKYLSTGDRDSASFYFKKAGAQDHSIAAAGSYLVARMQGNEFIAGLNLSIVEEESGKDNLISALRGVDVNDAQQVELIVSKLIDELNLSEKKMEHLDVYREAEMYGGYDSEKFDSLALNASTKMRLEIGAALRNQNYEGAVRLAADLADAHPKADNRLLLAETVAESAYEGIPLDGSCFAEYGDPNQEYKEDASIRKERDKLQKKMDALSSRIDGLDLSIEGEKNSDKQKELKSEKGKLTVEYKALKNRSDKLYVYRAFSSIADLHSVKAQLVRARLHFALQDYDKAVDTLLKTANSLEVMLTPNRSVSASLNKIADAYDKNSVVYEKQDFKETVQEVLSAPFNDLIGVTQAPITGDFADKVTSDQKEYGKGLFVTSLDASQFPKITVMLSGQETILEKILKNKDVVIRDSGMPTTYTSEVDKTQGSTVCIVADASGSMSGEPMMKLQEAIEYFISNKKPLAQIGLVGFDNEARILCDPTTDAADLYSGMTALDSMGGGTDISAGIQVGLDALETIGGERSILLMSDGESSLDESVLARAQQMGINIYTVGFGSVNDQLMNLIATTTGGQYLKADNLEELTNIFANLQGLMGNSLKLEYTVTNPEVKPMRYFFLKVDNNSVRRDYSLDHKEAHTELFNCSPSLVDIDTVAAHKESGSAMSFRLNGQLMNQVESVQIGGIDAVINDQSSQSLMVEIPAELSNGWNNVSLTLKDGSQMDYPQMILVDQVERLGEVRIGKLLIESAEYVQLADGRLLLNASQTSLRNFEPQEGADLDAFVNGMLLLPAYTPAQPLPEGESVDLSGMLDYGETGTVMGYGSVIISDRDPAAEWGAWNTPTAQGAFQLQCSKDQVLLDELMEGGEWSDAIS